MNRHQFPAIALALAVPLLAALWLGGQPAADGNGTALPLLTLLAISELGLIGSLIAFGLGVHDVNQRGRGERRALVTLGCGLAALAFLSQLVRWWPL